MSYAGLEDSEVWLRFLFLFGCYHGDGSGGGEEGSQQSPRLVRCSLSVATGLNYGALRRLPVPMSPNPLAEWRLYEEFLHAHDCQVWRQSIFVKTSTSSTSSRSWRWRCGGVVAPSGFVPGCDGAGSTAEMVFGPNRNFTFPVRVLFANPKDWLVIFSFFGSLGGLCCKLLHINLMQL